MNPTLLSVAAALAWCASFMGVILVLAYRRASLAAATAILTTLLIAYCILGAAADWWKIALAPVGLMVLLNVRPLRMAVLTRPFLK
jgi:hypothetical protein